MVPYWFTSLWRRLRPNSDSAVSPTLVQSLSPAIRPSLVLDVRGQQIERLRSHVRSRDSTRPGVLKKPWRVEKDPVARTVTGHLEMGYDYQSVLVQQTGSVLLLTGTSRPVDPPGTQLVQFELLSLDHRDHLRRSYSRLKTRVGPNLFSPVQAMTQMATTSPTPASGPGLPVDAQSG